MTQFFGRCGSRAAHMGSSRGLQARFPPLRVHLSQQLPPAKVDVGQRQGRECARGVLNLHFLFMPCGMLQVVESTGPEGGGFGLASARLQHRKPTPKDVAGATVLPSCYLRAVTAGGHSHVQERSGVEGTLGVYDFSRHPARINRLETRMDAGGLFTTLIAQNRRSRRA